MNPLISVITICYNENDGIKRTCDSVINQTYKNFEWIVIDGGSTDGTLDILEKYKDNMKYFISEKDNGIYNAMNKGIKKSKGNYLLFLNGGDFLKDNNILYNVSNFILDDKKESNIYYGDVEYNNGEIVTFKKTKLNKNFFINKTISHQASFIKSNLFDKYGYYNENYKIVSDFDFWIKTIVLNNVKTKYIPIIVSVFDLHGVSTKYSYMKKHIEERNNVLLINNIINRKEAIFLKFKWTLLLILKKIGVYFILKKIYRKFIHR